MRAAKTGKERHVVRLMRSGKRDEAVEYMKKNGLVQAFVGAPEGAPVGVGALSLSEGDRAMAKAFSESFPKDIPGDPNYRYPEFKVAREPVPEGVRWAKVKRELANVFQKVVLFEDDGKEGIAWLTYRQIQRFRPRLVGRDIPLIANPNKLQGGFVLWQK